MQSLEAMRKRIDTAEELHQVVKMMKGMAAANIRQFEAAVAALGDYARAIELGLQALLRAEPERLAGIEPEPAARLAAVVFGSDQGMCGRFNQQIAAHAAEAIRGEAVPPAQRAIVVVGARIAPLLEAEGLSVETRVAPATSLAGITPLVQEILLWIQQWRSAGAADRIVLFYNEALGGAAYRPHRHPLFPIDLDWLRGLQTQDWPSRRLPLYTIRWESLFAALLREHFYIAIFRAAAESLASENASRLASMQAAERNIEQRIDELNMAFRLQRQQAITEELLEIISGFEALSADERDAAGP